MMTLYETYLSILQEAVNVSDIINAIETKKVIRFYYEGDNTEHKGWRIGEIYVLGDSKAGNKVIRVYQLKGETDTVIPQWKLFLVDKIREIEEVRTFNRPRPNFNRSGDNSMVRVHNIVKF